MSAIYMISLVMCFFGGWFATGGVIENNTPKFLLGVALLAGGFLVPV